MPKRDGKQQGPQNHAEGEHGDKTRQRLIQQLHSRANGPAVEAPQEKRDSVHSHDRQQHDEAEKTHEKIRLARGSS